MLPPNVAWVNEATRNNEYDTTEAPHCDQLPKPKLNSFLKHSLGDATESSVFPLTTCYNADCVFHRGIYTGKHISPGTGIGGLPR